MGADGAGRGWTIRVHIRAAVLHDLQSAEDTRQFTRCPKNQSRDSMKAVSLRQPCQNEILSASGARPTLNSIAVRPRCSRPAMRSLPTSRAVHRAYRIRPTRQHPLDYTPLPGHTGA